MPRLLYYQTVTSSSYSVPFLGFLLRAHLEVDLVSKTAFTQAAGGCTSATSADDYIEDEGTSLESAPWGSGRF